LFIYVKVCKFKFNQDSQEKRLTLNYFCPTRDGGNVAAGEEKCTVDK